MPIIELKSPYIMSISWYQQIFKKLISYYPISTEVNEYEYFLFYVLLTFTVIFFLISKKRAVNWTGSPTLLWLKPFTHTKVKKFYSRQIYSTVIQINTKIYEPKVVNNRHKHNKKEKNIHHKTRLEAMKYQEATTSTAATAAAAAASHF